MLLTIMIMEMVLLDTHNIKLFQLRSEGLNSHIMNKVSFHDLIDLICVNAHEFYNIVSHITPVNKKCYWLV